ATDAGSNLVDSNETETTDATDTTTAAATTLDSVLPYAAGLNSALSLIQALQQGNTLSAVLAGSSLANTLNNLTDGAIPALPGELSFGLGALSTGLNLLDALDNGNELGTFAAGANLASQAASLWAASASANAFALDQAFSNASTITAEMSSAYQGALDSAASANAIAQGLGYVAGAFNIINSLEHGDVFGAATSALCMIFPEFAPVIAVVSSILGGLFGDDDGGEPPYIIVKASGDAHFVRHDDGSIGIESSGTNQHKSTEGTAVGAGTQGGQAVAAALGALLADLQSQVDAHNAAHPEAPFALIPERLPQLHWRDPAWYAEWTDAASGEPRSIAVSGRDLAGDLLAVAQSGAAVVPAWLADTITQRIEAGDTAAWRPAPTPEAAGDTQAQAILVLGSGAMDQVARSDIDADGWSEAHAWSANNLYLTVDSNGDSQIEGLRDLVSIDGEAHAPNRLGWLDADGNGLLDSNDPGFAALKLWLDANGDAVAQDGESAGLQAAGIVAIDFRSYPPALVDAAGNATALTETQLTGETKGIRTAQTDSGIQVAVEDGETVLLATRTTDYTGNEAHTHREEITIDAGGVRLQSQAAAAPAVVRTESRIEAGDARLKSGTARPVGVAPAATAEQELRSVTAQLISDSQNLFAAAGGLLTVMAFGAGSTHTNTMSSKIDTPVSMISANGSQWRQAA
ncbi:MAG: hypothetical protein Q7U97_04775, partial [Rhodocyclaceae bacterium]|nr:hypothetical protein [Rhodocyclaceae bacterium]